MNPDFLFDPLKSLGIAIAPRISQYCEDYRNSSVDSTRIWPYASDQPSMKPLLTKLTYDNYKSIGQGIMGLVGDVGSLNTPANSLIKTVISKGENIVLG
jgi:hypothetical protein